MEGFRKFAVAGVGLLALAGGIEVADKNLAYQQAMDCERQYQSDLESAETNHLSRLRWGIVDPIQKNCGVGPGRPRVFGDACSIVPDEKTKGLLNDFAEVVQSAEEAKSTEKQEANDERTRCMTEDAQGIPWWRPF